jgi:hypothetical protein
MGVLLHTRAGMAAGKQTSSTVSKVTFLRAS